MKVLVTGGGGFVGNVLCRDLLRRGYEVKCVDNFHKGNCDALLGLISKNGFEFEFGDVSNPEHAERMWDGVDACIHLAAIVGFPACEKQPALAEAVNWHGTNHVLHHAGDRPFVFASTGSVYGKVEGVCHEDSPRNPLNSYGITKMRAEYNVSIAENTVSFRFATGFGVSPNMRVNLLVNDFVHQACTNNCLNIFQADFRRTFIHVRDMSRAFIFGLENLQHLQHKVYNCGANHLNWTKRELAEYVCKKTGASASFMDVGEDKDQRDYEVDYGRLDAEGFKCIVGMEEGIDELIKATPLLQIKHQYM